MTKQSKITTEMIEKYIANPTLCPFCGSSEINASDFDGYTGRVDCDNCDETWYEEYKLVSINA